MKLALEKVKLAMHFADVEDDGLSDDDVVEFEVFVLRFFVLGPTLDCDSLSASDMCPMSLSIQAIFFSLSTISSKSNLACLSSVSEILYTNTNLSPLSDT